MKAVPAFGVFVSGIALLIPLVSGHPNPSSPPSCALTEKGKKTLYKLNDVVELHCPNDKDETYKVTCTDESSWLAVTECHGKKPTQKPAYPPKPTEKIPDQPKKPDHPPMMEPRPYRPRMPRRRPYDRDMRPDFHRKPMRPRMPDHGPYHHDMDSDHDHGHHDEDHRPMPRHPPRPTPDYHREPMPYHPPQPKPDQHHNPMPHHPPPRKPSPPVHNTPKPTTKAATTPPHIIPPANQVNPLDTRLGKPCLLRSLPYFFPHDPHDPRDNVPSGRSIAVGCPGHYFQFYAYCFDGTFYWPQHVCPPHYQR